MVDNIINKIINENYRGNPQSGSSIHCFQIELEFQNVGFCGGRKTEEPRDKDENRQQTQPT